MTEANDKLPPGLGRLCDFDLARVRTLAPDGDSLTTLCTARTAPDGRTRNAHISHTSRLTCFTDDTARGIAGLGWVGSWAAELL
jgi:hypothetical protein